jgi:nicotinamidase-related amidase
LKVVSEKTVPWRIRRDRCALLVIDMQNDFLKPGGVLCFGEKPMAVVPKIMRILEYCHKSDLPVIYTKTILNDQYNMSPLEASYQPALFQEGMRAGTWGAEIIDELTPQPGDQIVIKHRYDAFYNTNLELMLNNIRGLGVVDTVIIVGTVTNVCCESTARGAFMRDYKVVFVSDANGASDEEAHMATLSNISRFFGRVIDTEGLLQALSGGEDHLKAFID